MAISPLHIVVLNAVIFGVLATIFTVIAVATTAWQDYKWDYSALQKLNDTNHWQIIEPLSSDGYYIAKQKVTNILNDTEITAWVEKEFLYDTYTGVWQICNSLSDEALQAVGKNSRCFGFVTEYNKETTQFDENGKWLARMHNSAATCFIVSLVYLFGALVIGAIGISRRQVSVCMLTGVLYVLAAVFSVFGLGIFHSKNNNEKYECYALENIPEDLCSARTVTVLWSLTLGWVGVAFALIASSFWLFLVRALRVIRAKTINI
ncbi:uncharacterized protein LOC135461396 [Liolophura sinensis]|uniref:uncharacterized protein LOC135461396 n=1 Tax=Liolophura sinensis TaxID=3198878 RepID=UPI0031597B16